MRKPSQSKPPQAPTRGQSGRVQRGDRAKSDSSRESERQKVRGWDGKERQGPRLGERGEWTDSDSSRDSNRVRHTGREDGVIGPGGVAGWTRDGGDGSTRPGGREEFTRKGREQKRKVRTKQAHGRMEGFKGEGWDVTSRGDRQSQGGNRGQGQWCQAASGEESIEPRSRVPYGDVVSRSRPPYGDAGPWDRVPYGDIDPRGGVTGREVGPRGWVPSGYVAPRGGVHGDEVFMEGEGHRPRGRLVRRDSSLDGRVRDRERKEREQSLKTRNRPASLDRLPHHVNRGQHRDNSHTRGLHRERSPSVRSHSHRNARREHFRDRNPTWGQHEGGSHNRRNQREESRTRGQHKDNSNIRHTTGREEDVEQLFLDTKIEMLEIIEDELHLRLEVKSIKEQFLQLLVDFEDYETQFGDMDRVSPDSSDSGLPRSTTGRASRAGRLRRARRAREAQRLRERWGSKLEQPSSMVTVADDTSQEEPPRQAVAAHGEWGNNPELPSWMEMPENKVTAEQAKVTQEVKVMVPNKDKYANSKDKIKENNDRGIVNEVKVIYDQVKDITEKVKHKSSKVKVTEGKPEKLSGQNETIASLSDISAICKGEDISIYGPLHSTMANMTLNDLDRHTAVPGPGDNIRNMVEGQVVRRDVQPTNQRPPAGDGGSVYGDQAHPVVLPDGREGSCSKQNETRGMEPFRSSISTPEDQDEDSSDESLPCITALSDSEEEIDVDFEPRYQGDIPCYHAENPYYKAANHPNLDGNKYATKMQIKRCGRNDLGEGMSNPPDFDPDSDLDLESSLHQDNEPNLGSEPDSKNNRAPELADVPDSERDHNLDSDLGHSLESELGERPNTTGVDSVPGAPVGRVGPCGKSMLSESVSRSTSAPLSGPTVPRMTAAIITQDHPGSTLDHPGSTLDHPGSTVDHQGSNIDHPGSTVDHQGSSIDHPGSTVDHQGSKDHPGSTMDHPGSTMDHPGSIIDHPGSTNDHPGSKVDQPSSMMELSGPDVPTERPPTMELSGSEVPTERPLTMDTSTSLSYSSNEADESTPIVMYRSNIRRELLYSGQITPGQRTARHRSWGHGSYLTGSDSGANTTPPTCEDTLHGPNTPRMPTTDQHNSPGPVRHQRSLELPSRVHSPGQGQGRSGAHSDSEVTGRPGTALTLVIQPATPLKTGQGPGEGDRRGVGLTAGRKAASMDLIPGGWTPGAEGETAPESRNSKESAPLPTLSQAISPQSTDGSYTGSSSSHLSMEALLGDTELPCPSNVTTPSSEGIKSSDVTDSSINPSPSMETSSYKESDGIWSLDSLDTSSIPGGKKLVFVQPSMSSMGTLPSLSSIGTSEPGVPMNSPTSTDRDTTASSILPSSEGPSVYDLPSSSHLTTSSENLRDLQSWGTSVQRKYSFSSSRRPPCIGKESTPRDSKITTTRAMVIEMDLPVIPADSLASTHRKPPLPGKPAPGKLVHGKPPHKKVLSGKPGTATTEKCQTDMDGESADKSERDSSDLDDKPEGATAKAEGGNIQAGAGKTKAKGLQKFAIIRRIRGLGKHMRSSSKTRKTEK